MAPNIGESSTATRKSTRERRPNHIFSPGRREETAVRVVRDSAAREEDVCDAAVILDVCDVCRL